MFKSPFAKSVLGLLVGAYAVYLFTRGSDLALFAAAISLLFFLSAIGTHVLEGWKTPSILPGRRVDEAKLRTTISALQQRGQTLPWSTVAEYEQYVWNALNGIPGVKIQSVRRTTSVEPVPPSTEKLHTVFSLEWQRHPFAVVMAYPDGTTKWRNGLPIQTQRYVDYEGKPTLILLSTTPSGPGIGPMGKRTFVITGGVDGVERLIGQIAMLIRQFEAEKIGQAAEEQAVEALRKSLPAGWQVHRNLLLPGLEGEVDLVVMAPEHRTWIVEVKSYAGDVEYRDGELWRDGAVWEGIMDQLRKQAGSSGFPIVLWQPRAKDGFARPKLLEEQIYHHRGNPEGLARFFQEA